MHKDMKNIIKSTLLLLCGVCLFTACSDDNDSNPTLTSPTQFVLNTPAIAANNTIDLANSGYLTLTCSQPDYGFPAYTLYTVQVSLNSDMSNYTELSETSNSAKINVDAATLASTLTTMALEQGKTEDDFPIDVPVYIRLKANMLNTANGTIDGTEILSNIITLSNVHLEYSLPPVTVPEEIYLVGNFNGWDWGNSLTMVPVYGTDNVYWHMVYIDESGIKFNTAKSWDGNEKGYLGINEISGDLASEIVSSSDGNIASNNPGWYLMIVTASVVGRDIVYDVQFNKPEVRFIGLLVGGWDEGLGEAFTVPSTADGDFVSPEITTSLPGNDTDGCVRIYVKVPGYDWWKSEFIIFDKKIAYRGTGGDQDRVGCSAGQKVYLNFTSETGSIE